VHGSLCWHSHDDEDELFLILKGHLRIELEHAEAVELDEGEMFVVPKGVRHNPVAEQECLLMLIERKSTLHTGDVVTERRARWPSSWRSRLSDNGSMTRHDGDKRQSPVRYALD
jgi:mannose-6-phosphate isomerase-like protein (cupin superfamily)